MSILSTKLASLSHTSLHNRQPIFFRNIEMRKIPADILEIAIHCIERIYLVCFIGAMFKYSADHSSDYLFLQLFFAYYPSLGHDVPCRTFSCKRIESFDASVTYATILVIVHCVSRLMVSSSNQFP